MSRRAYLRTSAAIAATSHISRVVRDSLIAETDFRKDFQVTAEAIVSFGKDGVSFQRSVLFDAIKAVFGGTVDAVEVTDTKDSIWKVQIVSDRAPTAVAIVQGEKRFLVTHLALLSQDKQTRIKVFSHQAGEVNLPDDARQSWEAILEQRIPDYDEVGLIQDDFNATPTVTRNAIRDNLASGTISLDVLFPRTAKYYERLVGRCEDGTSFHDYVSEVASPLMRANIAWKALLGYQSALLLTGHAALSLALSNIETEKELLPKVLDWAAARGDAMSRASCIEIGLHRLSSDRSIKEPISKILDTLINNTPAAHIDQFKLMSALFIVAYGEVSFRRVFPSKPPFWRKLAALAQASMIARHFVSMGQDASEVVEWLMSVRAQPFVLQCLVDMRLEPRWFADLALPKQIRNEFIGRVWLAAKLNEEAVASEGLNEKFFGEGDGTLSNRFKLTQAFLPGPLEGGLNSPQEMPQELFDSIKADLSQATITTTSFLALANTAMIYRPSPELGDLAAAAIVRADYRLEIGESQVPLEIVLVALATIAAATRNRGLADAIFVVLRKYRRFYADELSTADAFRVAMMASASREQLLDWARCVGDCMNDIAFQRITPTEANALHSHIVCLCHLVPELWATCGQAEAALQAVMARQ